MDGQIDRITISLAGKHVSGCFICHSEREKGWAMERSKQVKTEMKKLSNKEEVTEEVGERGEIMTGRGG